jgi:PBP1b-binding outer membrane lipoprotein LpoB
MIFSTLNPSSPRPYEGGSHRRLEQKGTPMAHLRPQTPLAAAALAALIFFAVGCGPLSKRVDPDVDDSVGGTGIDSADVRAIADEMSRRIMATPEISRATTPPTIVLEPVKNGTPFVIDTDILLVKIRGLLNQHTTGRVTFLARERLDAIEAERTAKREGVFTSSGEKQLLGADFFLTGELMSISKQRDDARSDYILYTFQLIDTENSVIVWEHQYEVKKEGKQGTVYR